MWSSKLKILGMNAILPNVLMSEERIYVKRLDSYRAGVKWVKEKTTSTAWNSVKKIAPAQSGRIGGLPENGVRIGNLARECKTEASP
jgi:hypothetical protein